MGEAVLGAFLGVLLEKLAHGDVLNFFGHLKGVNRKTQEKWTTKLTEIEEVLNDAEQKQLMKPGVKMWLNDLRDLAYDLEDILDKFFTEMLQRHIRQQQGATTSKLWRPFSEAKFNYNMNLEIQEIDDRLQEICQRKDQFGLNNMGTSSAKEWKIPPSSCQPDGPVIGREKDKMKIFEFLSKEEPCATMNFHVVAIVGMPGVGKTTLAGHVFKDVAREKFDLKIWVSVSDDFDLIRVTKAILESATAKRVKEFKEFSRVQENLSKKLAGKKFLIVLDDVWNTCVYDLWSKLQSPFRVGAQGSKIIVTTRDSNVAKMMKATRIHNLEGISGDDCWKVFEQHAPLNLNNDMPAVSESLKKKIVAKCNGLPLAARTLGGLLCSKERDEWEEILNNKMWSLSDTSGILPVLKLSYHYIPSNLKRCFAYCSIFPSDYEFGEKQLVLLWMAEGLVQKQPQDNKQMEDIGSECFRELLSRSFFQKSSKNNSKYIMHDLVTDLARWAAGEICFRLEENSEEYMQFKCSPKARHSSYTLGMYDGVKIFDAYSHPKAIHLRTFLPLSLSSTTLNSYLAPKVTFGLLPKLHCLRVLSLAGYRITELPHSIGKLKHLRYLDLSHTRIMCLPESTSKLYNLQTLILEGCYKLKALPTNMRNLINLRHLNNSGVRLLGEMPPQLGQLTNLKTLPNFAVGKGSESGISEIGSLLHLQGTLRLSRLENVIGVEDARSANLNSKERLEALLLEWSYSSVSTEISSVVLDMLRPHSKLKELSISGYAGLKFSTWIGNPSFSHMVLVKLQDCNYCQFLPPFGQLPSLRKLHIQSMPAVESVGPEFYGEGDLPFRAIETLKFESMENWQEWSPFQQDLGIGVFACLKKLSIRQCPKLVGSLPENVDSLAKLVISGCEELVVSVGSYKQLHEANIRDCRRVVHTDPVHFDLLESLCFSNISELGVQTKDFITSLTKLKSLEVTGCEELTSSFKNEDRLLQNLISLGYLWIEDNSTLVEKLGKEVEELLQLQIPGCKLEYMRLVECRSLLKLPEGLHHLTYLQELHINRCSSLVSFPDKGLPPSLKVIKIDGCKSLLYFARYHIPSSLRRIEIWDCENLKSFIEKEGEVVIGSSHCLEFLEIRQCPSMMSLLCKGQLPMELKSLQVSECRQLELIADRFLENSCQLEELAIWECPNLKSLPEGMFHLTNLRSLMIAGCESLVSFPLNVSVSGSGSLSLPRRATSKLRNILILDCHKVEVVTMLREMHNNLNSLWDLTIDYCEGLPSFLEAQKEGFSPNLTSLTILKVRSCKALLESQGLHRLTSLRKLWIRGENDPDLLFFPPDAENEMLLPKTLIKLLIQGFPNLKKLSKGFQFLTSLKSLSIIECPKLASIPEEGLPLSLMHLKISGSPLLEEKCKAGSKGQYWPKISHIPSIDVHEQEELGCKREFIFSS
ncbi:putative P-loop containing nucleoside triphosphate hydrolase, leucine-rich repeat domain, L [Rosa chinensis]|uniref:Putative P-loop containing nucleoside triphosphate hydrolase, leucine-rich repeat domain, L n=1 Tax=Rosa chinensis TaxID=74649 RepID=A0A2P6PH33_ROSCH|nr:putative disease resistance RPP13-like protein 1 [Rosa chinensis]XP_024172691.1 putative disease resistance RPP13-like protein 1 [Rosa chinensis]XP_024172692.1 putative disease resistance RPP13-like protein 1 [Rosa chinensis]XP_024172694.1 putative disease resistance RPP13-like protein 1 [Rosa chinensis]XP_040365776.1 putative disease resistance RPP13-like protein 1 [Rosa chinensis]XP_040365777.1 putative disease resistance RPP13-like protein 1 [Rosa chinensis]PRQ21241.1 putative P-loop co